MLYEPFVRMVMVVSPVAGIMICAATCRGSSNKNNTRVNNIADLLFMTGWNVDFVKEEERPH